MVSEDAIQISNEFNGNRKHDNGIANRQRNKTQNTETEVWHHVDTNTMILVDREIHDTFPHTGGASILMYG